MIPFSVLPIVLMFQSDSAKKLYVVDKVTQVGSASVVGSSAREQQGEHHSAPVVMASFAKDCQSVSFTKAREDAEYVLETQPGGSTLSDQKGNVVYISPAKTLKNMTKDMCRFIAAH